MDRLVKFHFIFSLWLFSIERETDSLVNQLISLMFAFIDDLYLLQLSADKSGDGNNELVDKEPNYGEPLSAQDTDAPKDSQPIVGEDIRFAVPSETNVQNDKSSLSSDTVKYVPFVEPTFVNATANDALVQASTEEHELETRLK